MNNNLKKLFYELINKKEIRERFVKQKNLEDLYNLCLSIVDGYSLEEFKEWLKSIILLRDNLSENIENLSDGDLAQVAGGVGSLSRAKIAIALLGVMLPIAGIAACSAQGNDPSSNSEESSVVQQAEDVDSNALNELAETAEGCIHADFEVSTLDDLNQLRELSKKGETFEGKVIRLKNDINITSDGNPDGGAVEFESIFGKGAYNEDGVFVEGTGFKGTFDGNGKCLHCNVSNGEILGDISKGGVVKNLNVTGHFEGIVDGPLVRENKGTIENCKLNAIVKDTVDSIGGMCLLNYGVVNNCEVRGEISTNSFSCGGICGSNAGTGEIINCRVYAQIRNCVESLCDEDFGWPETGGVVAWNHGLVRDCTVEADVSSVYKGEYHGFAGGIVSTNNGLIENSNFKGPITAASAGGIVSNNYGIIQYCKIHANIKGFSAAELASGNVWGYEVYIECEAIKGKDQGVIDNCEFTGTVDAEKTSVGVADNFFQLALKKEPQVTNCKINGVEWKVIKSNGEYHL